MFDITNHSRRHRALAILQLALEGKGLPEGAMINPCFDDGGLCVCFKEGEEIIQVEITCGSWPICVFDADMHCVQSIRG